MEKIKEYKMIKQKKALSEVIGYVILIVIALSLSVVIYSWLKFQIPKQKPECPEDISVVIKDYECNSIAKKINITFQNKGLFDIDGIYIKIANETNKIPVLELEPTKSEPRIREKGFLYFFNANNKLETGESVNSTESIAFTYLGYNKIKKVSLMPFVMKNNKIVLCSASEVKEEVVCD